MADVSITNLRCVEARLDWTMDFGSLGCPSGSRLKTTGPTTWAVCSLTPRVDRVDSLGNSVGVVVMKSLTGAQTLDARVIFGASGSVDLEAKTLR
ncbi:hypothetical protein LTR22_026727 [Elasticomyces elasticus]|nr:hypothetical protein LTR22_026727 [Elasticomyces elasticus]